MKENKMPTPKFRILRESGWELVRYRAPSNIANGELRMATFEYKFGWNVVGGVAQRPKRLAISSSWAVSIQA